MLKGLERQVKISYTLVHRNSVMAKKERKMTFLWKIVRMKMYYTSEKDSPGQNLYRKLKVVPKDQ